MKKIIKKIWKDISKKLLKIYTNKSDLYISNNPHLDNKTFYSQFGQDEYVFKEIFKEKKNGFFVDIGANHPIEGSNTYLLELNDWNGLAIEPQENLKNLWPNSRKTECLPYVIGSENKTVEFVEGTSDQHGLAGVVGFNKVKTASQIRKIEQIRLSDLLSKKQIFHVDFLSIDVEGYEMNILESIDFDTVDIKVICLENDINFTSIPFIGKRLGSELGNNKIRKYLEKRGYTYIARIVCDDFFIKNETN